MGKRGSMKGRPGFFFIFVVIVCLVILYMSWRTIMAPKTTVRNKGSYSRQYETFISRNAKPESKLSFNMNSDLQKKGYQRNQDSWNIDTQSKGSRFNVKVEDADVRVPLSDSRQDVHKETDIKGLRKEDAKVVKTPDKLKVEYYQEPQRELSSTLEGMDRFVHLDLKGAAPHVSYLRQLFPLLSSFGATGLLVEYEDMFPYSGRLEKIKATNSYSKDDIELLLNTAKENNLKVMPLIQTFGHMEFVLKSAFADLRESNHTPQAIDITSDKTYDVLSEMILQILGMHPHITHLHIGCDEVYELGRGRAAALMTKEGLSKHQVFLKHVQKVASIVSTKSQRQVIPVMWDDELRNVTISDIQKSNLPSLVQIMVWAYTDDVLDRIGSAVWEKYSSIFKSVWIASSFKGSSGPRQFFPEPLHHIKNHFSWLNVMSKFQGSLNFKGVALTGWQRYDHFATLCELLPAAVPSVAVCLATLKSGGFNKEIHTAISKKLKCNGLVEMSFPKIDRETKRAVITQDCRFPGNDIFYLMQQLYGNSKIVSQHRLDGWLSDYQVSHGFSNPGQIKWLFSNLKIQRSGYYSLGKIMEKQLATIYSHDVIEEWIEEQINEPLRRINETQRKAEALLKHSIWPQRPLKSDLQLNASVVGDSIAKLNNNNQIQDKKPLIPNSNQILNSLKSASLQSGDKPLQDPRRSRFTGIRVSQTHLGEQNVKEDKARPSVQRQNFETKQDQRYMFLPEEDAVRTSDLRLGNTNRKHISKGFPHKEDLAGEDKMGEMKEQSSLNAFSQRRESATGFRGNDNPKSASFKAHEAEASLIGLTKQAQARLDNKSGGGRREKAFGAKKIEDGLDYGEERDADYVRNKNSVDEDDDFLRGEKRQFDVKQPIDGDEKLGNNRDPAYSFPLAPNKKINKISHLHDHVMDDYEKRLLERSQ